jgi:hypothetical protein
LRTAAGTEDDIRANLPGLESSFQLLKEAVERSRSDGLSGDEILARGRFSTPWGGIIRSGRRVVDGVLSQRSIPERGAKSLEMVYRLMINSRQVPRDAYKWLDANGKRIEFLIEAAKTWPAKQEGGEELFALGPFRVHNTIGVKGPELELLKKGLERVVKAVGTNPIPGFSRVLYGDVHVVAQLTKAHHAAWYFPKDDSIYLRRTKSTGMDEVHAVIHELGHRYWHKFASADRKREWYGHHIRAGAKPITVELPKVGDKIPVKVKGALPKVDPVVTDKSLGLIYYTVPLKDGRIHNDSIREDRVVDFYRQQQKAAKNFPTPYSSVSEQEHFCDSLALLALGNLPNEFEVPFKAIWA